MAGDDTEHAVVRAWAQLDERVAADSCDGVPVFWAEMPAPRQAHLMFRVGRADEPFSRAGISHLVEHLTLSTLGDRLYEYNGSVSADLTTFTAAGNDDDLVEFLALVCSALHSLPLDRLEAERRVLSTEAARRTPDPLSALLWARYGNTGVGMLACEEHALRSAGPDEIQAWSDVRFTSPNAALILTGPPPAGLHIELPTGSRFGDASSLPVAQPLPTFFQRNSQVVSLGTVLPREREGKQALSRHLQRRMAQRLRNDLGITYSVLAGGLRVDRDSDHLTLTADALPDQATAVTTTMIEELDRIAEQGVDREELDRDIEQTLRAAQTANAVGSVLGRRAATMLRGETLWSHAQTAVRVVTLTTEEVAGLAAKVRQAAMWLVPAEATVPAHRFQEYLEWSPLPAADVCDRYFKPLAPSTREIAAVGLAVGDEGITMVLTGARYITVRWAECTGMQWWTTGQRSLCSEDGFRIHVDPAHWERAEEIRATIDARVPEDRRIPMGPMESAPPSSAQRPTKRRRWYQDGLTRGAIVAAATAVITWAELPNLLPSAPAAPIVNGVRVDPVTQQVTVVPSDGSSLSPITSNRTSAAGAITVAVLSSAAAVGLAGAVVRRRRRES